MGNTLHTGRGEQSDQRARAWTQFSNLQGAGNDTEEEEEEEDEECAGRESEKDVSVEFRDLVKTNVGTGLANGLANTLSIHREPRH